MATIIDGYNLIFQCGLQSATTDAEMLRRARGRLLNEILASVSNSFARTITVVFDAAERPLLAKGNKETVGGVKVLFADEYDDADSMIEHLIAKHSVPRKLTVVSSDHRLHKAALRRRATPIDSDVWYERLMSGRWKVNSKKGKSASKSFRSAEQEMLGDLNEIDWHEELQSSQLDVNAIANDIEQESEPTSTKQTDQTEPAPTPPEKPVADHFNPFPPGYADDLLDEDDHWTGN